MATGQTLYSDISSVVNNIFEDSLFVLRETNLVAKTFTVFNDTMEMNPRKIYKWGEVNPRTISEGDDMVATQFSKSSLATLTPAGHGDQVFLHEHRLRSDWDNVRAAAALELGSKFADYVDALLCGLYTSSTGGTVGAAGSTLTWNYVFAARAVLQGASVPGPYFCVLHPYQWHDLVIASNVSDAGFHRDDNFQSELTSNYFVTPLMGGVTFVVSANVGIDGSDDATGAMYNRQAFAYDERQPFRIVPQLDASRRGWELNASMDFAYGVWDADRAVQIISDATTPA